MTRRELRLLMCAVLGAAFVTQTAEGNWLRALGAAFGNPPAMRTTGRAIAVGGATGFTGGVTALSEDEWQRIIVRARESMNRDRNTLFPQELFESIALPKEGHGDDTREPAPSTPEPSTSSADPDVEDSEDEADAALEQSNEFGHYLLQIRIDRGAGSAKWADYFGKPDIFVAIEFSALGPFIVPALWNALDVDQLDFFFVGPRLKAGDVVSILILDDDSWSSETWSRIAKIGQHSEIGKASFGGSLLALDEASQPKKLRLKWHDVVIDGADLVASQEFQVAPEPDGRWAYQIALETPSGQSAGALVMQQVRQTTPVSSSTWRLRSLTPLFLIAVAGIIVLLVIKSLKLEFSKRG